MQSRRGGARSSTVLLTRGRYGFATNESRCHESVQNVDRQGALCPPDTVAVRHRSGPSDVGESAAVRCHESVTSRYVRAWAGSDVHVRKALQIKKYRVHRCTHGSTSRDLKSAQCRLESVWGDCSPDGFGFPGGFDRGFLNAAVMPCLANYPVQDTDGPCVE